MSHASQPCKPCLHDWYRGSRRIHIIKDTYEQVNLRMCLLLCVHGSLLMLSSSLASPGSSSVGVHKLGKPQEPSVRCRYVHS